MGLEGWRRVRSEVESDLRVIRVRRDAAVSPRTGEEHEFVVLESPDWVTVVPFTEDGRLVLVRQYRHGLGELTVEFPGGLVEDGHSPEEAARAELRQETGFAGGEWSRLGALSAVPALFDNRLHVFLARGVHRVCEPELDPGEDISTELLHPTEVRRMVAAGEIVHAPVVASLFLFDLIGFGDSSPPEVGPHTDGVQASHSDQGDVRSRVYGLIRSHHVATVATVGPAGAADAGSPHAASVFYAVDKHGRLVFLSKGDSRHGGHIGGTAPVAVTVAAPHSDWHDIHGVQLWGRAERLSGSGKVHAMTSYLARFPFVSALLRDPKLVERLRGIEVYRVTPERAALTDNRRGPFGREVVEL